MGRTTITFVMVMTGLMVLFYFTGILDPEISASATLLEILLSPQTMNETIYNNYVGIALLSIGTIAIVLIGFLTKETELAARSAFTIAIFSLMWDFVIVFNSIRAEMPVLSILFFAPIMIMFLINLVDYWGGRD